MTKWRPACGVARPESSKGAVGACTRFEERATRPRGSGVRENSRFCRYGSRGMAAQLHKPRRQLRSHALIFVFEKDKCLLPALFTNSPAPCGQFAVVIVRASETDVAPRGGGDEGNLQVTLGFGNAQGSAVAAQCIVNLVVKPGSMSELEC